MGWFGWFDYLFKISCKNKTSSKAWKHQGLYHLILYDFFIYSLNFFRPISCKGSQGFTLYKVIFLGEKDEHSLGIKWESLSLYGTWV